MSDHRIVDVTSSELGMGNGDSDDHRPNRGVARFCGFTVPRSSMGIRAVVFDLDGLMFDTEALFYRVSSEALAARGKQFTPAIMQAMLGRRADEVRDALRTLAGLDEPAE